MTETKFKRVTLSLDEKIISLIEQQAKKNHLNHSSLIRILVLRNEKGGGEI